MVAIDLIVNLKGLNHYATYHHFKMDTLYPMLKLVEKDCYMVPLDLKDAYYWVAVKPFVSCGTVLCTSLHVCRTGFPPAHVNLPNC